MIFNVVNHCTNIINFQGSCYSNNLYPVEQAPNLRLAVVQEESNREGWHQVKIEISCHVVSGDLPKVSYGDCFPIRRKVCQKLDSYVKSKDAFEHYNYRRCLLMSPVRDICVVIRRDQTCAQQYNSPEHKERAILVEYQVLEKVDR